MDLSNLTIEEIQNKFSKENEILFDNFNNKNMKQSKTDKIIADFVKATTETNPLIPIQNRIIVEFLSKVDAIMQERSMKCKDLAAKMNISKKLLKSIFRFDTVLDVKMMAKMELALDMQIVIRFTDKCYC